MLAYPLIWFVKTWRALISPLYGDVCKFYPSCSSYGLTALETHGGLKGTSLLISRLVKCHPWSLGGVDYVPGTPQAAAFTASSGSAEANSRGVN